MKPDVCLVSMLAMIAAAIAHEVAAADVPQVDLTEWTPPQMRSVAIRSASSSNMVMH
jgi:hypothetical protein